MENILCSCGQPATFNYQGCNLGVVCQKHRLNGMINVKRLLTCSHVNCDEGPLFCFQDSASGFLCSVHRFKGMVAAKESKLNSSTSRINDYSLRDEQSMGMKPNARKLTEIDVSVAVEQLVTTNKIVNSEKIDKENSTKSLCASKNPCGKKDHSKHVCSVENVKEMNDLKQVLRPVKSKRKCEHMDCRKWAGYNFPNQKPARFCSTHKLNGMRLCNFSLVCRSEGCKVLPSYNFKGEKSAVFCFKHKMERMVNVRSVQCCKHNGCLSNAYYNFEGKQHGIYCRTHMSAGMVPVKKRLCEKEGCVKVASMNFAGEKRGRFCCSHKIEGMSLVFSPSGKASKRKRPVCEAAHCEVWPNYNYTGRKPGRFCNSHKLTGMVNVKTRTACQYPGCSANAYYNTKGKHPAAFCSKHCGRKMVRVGATRVCLQEGCEKHPCFGFVGDRRPSYCSRHKRENMVNVKHRRCEGEGCDLQASYGFNNQRRYCTVHKKDGMTLANYNRCLHPGCNTYPSFNFKGQTRAAFCARHKSESMVSFIQQRKARRVHRQVENMESLNQEGSVMDQTVPNQSSAILQQEIFSSMPDELPSDVRNYNRLGYVFTNDDIHLSPGMRSVMNEIEIHPKAVDIETRTKTLQKLSFSYPLLIELNALRQRRNFGGFLVAGGWTLCEALNCEKRRYNHEGESSGRFCIAHKGITMVDVSNTWRTLGSPLGNSPASVASFDSNQTGDDAMIPTQSSSHGRCAAKDCLKWPIFSVNGAHPGQRCFDHAVTGMLPIYKNIQMFNTAEIKLEPLKSVGV